MKRKVFFSVRSAYRMLVINKHHATEYMENIAGRSDTKAEEKEWLGIWKLDLPSKIRVFLWRLARHSLPSGDILFCRHMAQQSSCGICGAHDSWKHSLIECNLARCVWALERAEVTDFLYSIQETNAHAWWVEAAEKLMKANLIRVAVTLWAIWFVRRKAIHEHSFQSPLSTHCFIDRYIADLNLIKPEQGGGRGTQQQVPRWIPPPADTLKINVDTAISKNTGRAAAAAVARDGTGAFQGASVLITQGVTDPESMEAIACREGLALASDLAIRKVRIASDNINVVKNIRGDSKGIYGHIVQEIKARAGSFASSEFVHEGRASNEDAHKLARSSVYCDLGRQVWFVSPPEGICIYVPINN